MSSSIFASVIGMFHRSSARLSSSRLSLPEWSKSTYWNAFIMLLKRELSASWAWRAKAEFFTAILRALRICESGGCGGGSGGGGGGSLICNSRGLPLASRGLALGSRWLSSPSGLVFAQTALPCLRMDSSYSRNAASLFSMIRFWSSRAGRRGEVLGRAARGESNGNWPARMVRACVDDTC